MQKLIIKPGHVTMLRDGRQGPEQVHVFDKREIDAINTALFAGRPLLLRGEPGVGKSQLALAAAKELGRAFVAKAVDANTEAHDLLWRFDAVARLAEAQVQGVVLGTLQRGREEAGEAIRQSIAENLSLNKFVHPQALWWALNWESAVAQAQTANSAIPKQGEGYDYGKGVVALVDEIDKADGHVPNGLLEALGSGLFHPFGSHDPICSDGRSPLIVITTNEERRLPDAFVRRCIVLPMRLPEERGALVSHLIERACAHFGIAEDDEIEKKLLRYAADLLADDREHAEKEHLVPLPGQAEYLDLLRAVRGMASQKYSTQMEMLDELRDYVFKKGVS
jgi:MoxR-like ATPase